MKGGAKLSDDGQYRYLLVREWGPGPKLAWVMLNPSTADASVNDATIRRCIAFTDREGFNGMYVVNLFAIRSRNPSILRQRADPVGVATDKWIQWAATKAPAVVVAWGNHGAHHPFRVGQVLELLTQTRTPLKCLGLTGRGQPCHPLMLSANKPLENYENV